MRLCKADRYIHAFRRKGRRGSSESEKYVRKKKQKEDSQAVARETQNVADAVRIEEQKEHPVYHTPPISLLKKRKESRWRFRCAS